MGWSLPSRESPVYNERILGKPCSSGLKNFGPVAQMDRATASEAVGREFESHRVHHFIQKTSLFSQQGALPSLFEGGAFLSCLASKCADELDISAVDRLAAFLVVVETLMPISGCVKSKCQCSII